jgi:uncharacterized protein (DUF1778 family)
MLGGEGRVFMEHPARKDDTIQIRTTAKTKAVLSRAAELRGQKLSEFMLDSARRQAEEALLDQRAFFLEPKVHKRFLAMLDAPAKPSPQVKALMKRKTSWEA